MEAVCIANISIKYRLIQVVTSLGIWDYQKKIQKNKQQIEEMRKPVNVYVTDDL